MTHASLACRYEFLGERPKQTRSNSHKHPYKLTHYERSFPSQPLPPISTTMTQNSSNAHSAEALNVLLAQALAQAIALAGKYDPQLFNLPSDVPLICLQVAPQTQPAPPLHLHPLTPLPPLQPLPPLLLSSLRLLYPFQSSPLPRLLLLGLISMP
jgi:hypothetical protein